MPSARAPTPIFRKAALSWAVAVIVVIVAVAATMSPKIKVRGEAANSGASRRRSVTSPFLEWAKISRRVGRWRASGLDPARFQRPLIKPCVKFYLTRLSDDD